MMEPIIDESSLEEQFCLFCTLDEATFLLWILGVMIVDIEYFEAFVWSFVETFVLFKFIHFDYNLDSLSYFLLTV